jgi:DNA-binding PadR family transcriptional regulator
MEGPSYFSVVPADVRYDKRLKPNAKLMYGEITALCNQEGYCWAGNDYFAGLYEVSKETISRWISQLKDYGYISVEVFPNDGNKRRIAIAQKVKTYCQKNQDLLTKKSRPIDKKVNPYNRINNTINNTINREAPAFDFLKQNYPSRVDAFMMKYASQIPGFEAFKNDYNLKVVEEQKEWEPAVLFARLERLASNWIRNAGKMNPKSVEQPPQYHTTPNNQF